MFCELKRHPHTPCDTVEGIAVEVARHGSDLQLRYCATGRIGALQIPARSTSVRADDLWRHTCFEAFIKETGADTYHEFNFAPSTQWAAYSFTGYRDGMRVLSDITPREIGIETTAASFCLRAHLLLPNLLNLLTNATWRLGLSAVIEETNGAKSYWALAHPPGKPDFHHPDCFGLELPPASAA
jgi:hypothetical protein